VVEVSSAEVRFTVPLYSVSEAARYLGVPTSTFSTWAHGYVRRPAGRAEVVGEPVVTTLRSKRSRRGDAAVPFIGLAEGLVLAAIRRAGVPLQRIRPAIAALQAEFNLEHVLASRALYTDGAEVLYDFAEREGDTPEARSARDLVVVRYGQRVFTEVVDAYLHRVEFAPDGYVRLIRLPQYDRAQVVADPDRAFGQPFFVRGGARVEDVLDRFRSGESLGVVAEEYGVPKDELEDALRVATRIAA
jgi:uncharacterized protein (DUF433 family)